MKFSISFNIPDGVDVGLAEVDKCTADVSISGVSVAAMRKVLAELSEMSLRDFARLATLSALTHDEDIDKVVESGIVDWCSFGSALPDAILSSGKHPLNTQPT